MQHTNLLSPKEAAAYMGCTVSKIRKDIRLKKLAIVKVGSLVRIRKDFLNTSVITRPPTTERTSITMM